MGIPVLPPFIAQNSTDGFAYFLQDIPTLITIYNAADRYRSETVYDTSVPIICGIHDYLFEACVHNGQFDPLLAAGSSGTMLNTVSENYARELQKTGLDWTTDWLGHRLAGYGVKIVGISTQVGLTPETSIPWPRKRWGLPPVLHPSVTIFPGKQVCKQALLAECNFKRFRRDTATHLCGSFSASERVRHLGGYPLKAGQFMTSMPEHNDAFSLPGLR